MGRVVLGTFDLGRADQDMGIILYLKNFMYSAAETSRYGKESKSYFELDSSQ